MTVRFIAQYPTVQYGYIRVEVEGDTFEGVYPEFVTAAASAVEEATRQANPVPPGQAVQNLQAQGVVPQGQAGTGLPQVSAPPWAATTPQEQAAFIPPAQPQAQQQWQPSTPQQQAPAQGPNCQHGPRTPKSGTSKRGPWSAWFCPTPKGTPGQCDPIFN